MKGGKKKVMGSVGRELKICIKVSKKSLTENGVCGKDLKEVSKQPPSKGTLSRSGVNASQTHSETQPRQSHPTFTVVPVSSVR